MPPTAPVWYAAYTHSRAEKKVASELTKLGIDHYLPLVLTLRQWSDRKKKVEIPLIRSYIFVHIRPKEHLPVLQIPGVVKIVHFCGVPVPIPDWQIRNLKILLGAAVPMSTNFRDYEKGEEVQIVQGTLKGLRGKILHVKGMHKLAISINALDYNLTIDIDPSFVESMNSDANHKS
ncbi:MAG TPA: UpxY family transcription antiterminator [Bacteroidales bacterium]|nr:UpxY family transcription antiterminator [Bacteroidales bacterium]